MSKYISAIKTEDGETRLEINPVSSEHKTYQIRFNEPDGATQFLIHTNGKSEILCNHKFIGDQSSSTIMITFDTAREFFVKPSYVAMLDDSQWTSDHIDDIKQQLVEQADSMEQELELKNELAEIEDAIRNKGYATLIQNLIRSHADQLTDMQVMDIQDTLTRVKEDKRLTPRQIYRFGL